MLNRAIKRLFFIFSTVFLLTGCVNTLQLVAQDTPVELIPRNKVMGGFSFVIPDNFRFMNEQSLVYDYRDDIRAYLVYAGKASTVQLVNFFTDYMTDKGWKPDFATVSTDGMLAFKKEDRLIVIKITPDVAGVSYIRILLTK